MDWRRDHGAGPDAVPSFLYAVPLDAEHTLLRRPAWSGGRRSGSTSCAGGWSAAGRRGVELHGDERVERVRFSVEAEAGAVAAVAPRAAGPPGPLGARAGVMHPATGYGVAVSLRLAEEVAQAARRRGATTPGRCLLSQPAARRVQRLREMGLTTLLQLPADAAETFFAAFFSLPPAPTARLPPGAGPSPAGTVAAMARMAATLPPTLTAVAVSSALPGGRRRG